MRTLRADDRLLVFSPHFDDAVFSCAELIARHAGATVLTVFAAPPDADGLTEWDAACGFRGARQALEMRRKEDDAALSLLSAQAERLEFRDSQYRATPATQALSEGLDRVLRRSPADVLLLPAGLFHSDHVLLHRALIALRPGHARKRWLLYEDALYRRLPGLLQRRLAELADAGLQATPLYFPSDHALAALKQRAVACYASQLRGLTAAADGYADAFLPERYWMLEDAGEAPR